ncbi:MAG TPA: hypothetical protein VKT82_26025 [Ktedonobacterales bacterium]|nr:hypothetical protein [Ktedonobacterales bacterium]
MQFFINLHIAMFFFLLGAGTICFLWGLGLLLFRRQSKSISSIYRSALRVTAAMALLQAIIGAVLLFIFRQSPTDQLHYVYGGLVFLAIPIALIYGTGKPEHIRRDLLFLVIAALVVAAAAVRAAMTGGFQF